MISQSFYFLSPHLDFFFFQRNIYQYLSTTLDGKITTLDITKGSLQWSIPTEPGDLLSSLRQQQLYIQERPTDKVLDVNMPNLEENSVSDKSELLIRIPLPSKQYRTGEDARRKNRPKR